MEAQLLREMIADRDQAIEKSKRKSEEQSERENELLSALVIVRGEAQEQSEKIRNEKKELVNAQRIAYERLHLLQVDFARQCSSLQTYCKSVAAEKNEDPSYIMRVQAQLCKAMHSMAITDHQFDLVKEHTDTIVKYQKEKVSVCVEEKTHTELKHMNDLMAIDIQKREEKVVFEAKLSDIVAEQDVLAKQIEENEDSDEEEEESEEADEDELDEEEKQAKEDMMRVLTERKQEIVKLEKEQEENEETITELEEQLEELEIVESVPDSIGNNSKDEVDDDDDVPVPEKNGGVDHEPSDVIDNDPETTDSDSDGEEN